MFCFGWKQIVDGSGYVATDAWILIMEKLIKDGQICFLLRGDAREAEGRERANIRVGVFGKSSQGKHSRQTVLSKESETVYSPGVLLLICRQMNMEERLSVEK